MQIHEFLDEDLRETAALFVLDSLEPDEARAFRLHVLQCDVCRREVESLARSARDLALLAPSRTPSPELWDRVVARIRSGSSDCPVVRSPDAKSPAMSNGGRGQVWKAWADTAGVDRAGFLFVGSADNGFEPTGFEGIEARRLFVDHDHDRVTMLVRMKPGARYPGHVHAAAEECYVLAGDLHVGDRRMHAGDYQRAEPGSTHPVQSTDEGCVLLLVSSLHDELT
jgi:quercetin dioxygenase-like cupin family protein